MAENNTIDFSKIYSSIQEQSTGNNKTNIESKILIIILNIIFVLGAINFLLLNFVKIEKI